LDQVGRTLLPFTYEIIDYCLAEECGLVNRVVADENFAWTEAKKMASSFLFRSSDKKTFA
jgi:enoyl-CoA hydratase/carnithine racemase